ncbi:DNA-binding protein [Advenella sp. S44]|nr:DNA-binding protein [Advenella sp. S44]
MASEHKGPEAYYFERLEQGIFEIQQCVDCHKHQFYPRTLCVHCGGSQLIWNKPSGTGTVYSYSIVRRKPEAGGDYNVVLIDLEEGVRLMSSIENCALADIHIGQKVQARVARRDDAAVVVFDAVEVAHA